MRILQHNARFAKYGLVACTVLLSLVTPCVLSGCVTSDTITERIYDNSEDSQVDENVTPVLVNSINAKQTSESLPKLEDDPDSDSKNDTDQTLPVYTNDPNKAQTDDPAPQPVYNKNATSAGEATVKKPEKEEPEEQEKDDGEIDNTKDPDDGSKEETTDDKSDKQKESKDSKNKSDKKKSSGGDDEGGDGEGKTSGGTGKKYQSDPDAEDPDIPENIDEVAAVGNNAVIVSMVAGTEKSTPLLACDKATKKQMGSIMAARGLKKSTALWSNDGSSSGDLSDSNLKKLTTKLVPDLVFVTEGSDTLTKAQIKALAKKNIDVYYLPELTSAKRIRFAVSIVGKILAKGGVEGAEDNYKAYLDFHDGIVSSCTDANGGFTADYDFDNDKSLASSKQASEMQLTLYIDGWDSDARFKDPYNYITTKKGVAVATIGYELTPMAYYLGAGGALNNGAAKKFRSQGVNKQGIVWQFAHAELPYKFSSWSNLTLPTYDLCERITGDFYKSDLCWYTNPNGKGYGLGTKNFTGVVTKTQKIASLVKSNSDSAGELYYPYPTIYPSGGDAKTIGYFTDAGDENYIESCIGNNSTDESVLEDGTTFGKDGNPFGIYVNPKGLGQEDSEDTLCSWTDGSVESVLEASWAYYMFRDGTQSDFEKDVTDFYETFYGYTLTDDELATIEAGCEK